MISLRSLPSSCSPTCTTWGVEGPRELVSEPFRTNWSRWLERLPQWWMNSCRYWAQTSLDTVTFILLQLCMILHPTWIQTWLMWSLNCIMSPDDAGVHGGRCWGFVSSCDEEEQPSPGAPEVRSGEDDHPSQLHHHHAAGAVRGRHHQQDQVWSATCAFLSLA